jgi:hypothetical protein
MSSMKAPTRHVASAPAVPEVPPPRTLRTWFASALLILVLAGVVMGFFLWIFPAKNYTVPVGWDQSEYQWRTKYAQVVGLAHIDQAPGSAKSAKSGRPAFPVVAATLSSLGRIDPFRVAVALPSVMAAVVGLAAAAFVAGVLKRPPWQLAAVALAVCLSPFVVRLMQPEAYMDNLFAAAVFLAAAIPLAIAVEERLALIPAVLLLGAGATIHWAFFAFMAAVLLLCGATYLPLSWKRWRSGLPLWDTPTARIGESLAGGALLGTGMIFAILGNGLPKPRVDVSEFSKKLRSDLPKYKFPVTVPLAALGVVALGADLRPDQETKTHRWRIRFVLAFLVSWSLVVLAGYVAKNALHIAIPAHRFLAFGLAVPILAVLGVLSVWRLLARVNVVAAAVVVAAVLAVSAWVSHDQWAQAKAWTDPIKVKDASTVAAYLDATHVPTERPVVFVIGTKDWSSAALWGHMIRASMPGKRIADVYVYVGTAESYLAHQPSGTKLSESYFTRVEPAYARHPVAVIASSFNAKAYPEWAQSHPELRLTDRVSVIEGPAPPSAIPPHGPPVGRMSPVYLAMLGGFEFVVLALVGWGWALALLMRWLRPVEILAVAPAVGVAALVLGGIVIDGVGIRLVGLGGAAAPVAVSLAGWAAAWFLLRRRNPASASA